MEEQLEQETTGLAQADPTVLNFETASTIMNMIKSNDEGDHKVAQVLLTQVNVEKSIYWIWKIATSHWGSSRAINLRTKAGRKLRDDSNYFSIANQNAGRFMSWLKDKSWLTPEIFLFLQQDILDELKYKIGGVVESKPFNIYIEINDEFKVFNPEFPYTRIK